MAPRGLLAELPSDSVRSWLEATAQGRSECWRPPRDVVESRIVRRQKAHRARAANANRAGNRMVAALFAGAGLARRALHAREVCGQGRAEAGARHRLLRLGLEVLHEHFAARQLVGRGDDGDRDAQPIGVLQLLA